MRPLLVFILDLVQDVKENLAQGHGPRRIMRHAPVQKRPLSYHAKYYGLQRDFRKFFLFSILIVSYYYKLYLAPVGK